jgi:hypothetical protein
MPKTPAELRMEAEGWLRDLRVHPRPLNRHLFLVPGITDELAGCWRWIVDRGRLLVPNWDSYVTVVTFDDLRALGAVHPSADFVDLGAYVHDRVLEVCGPSGTSSAQFDVVCHSMGGLDAFAALVPLLGRYPDATPLPTARYLITLDTPWRGVLNWDIRCRQADVGDPEWPGRPTQCAALRPGSLELVALLEARPELHGAVERVICMSADRESPIEVEWSSSNLCSDVAPAALWPRGPTYRAHMIPGTCHSGIGGITWSPITIAQVFNYLLFNA